MAQVPVVVLSADSEEAQQVNDSGEIIDRVSVMLKDQGLYRSVNHTQPGQAYTENEVTQLIKCAQWCREHR